MGAEETRDITRNWREGTDKMRWAETGGRRAELGLTGAGRHTAAPASRPASFTVHLQQEGGRKHVRAALSPAAAAAAAPRPPGVGPSLPPAGQLGQVSERGGGPGRAGNGRVRAERGAPNYDQFEGTSTSRCAQL